MELDVVFNSPYLDKCLRFGWYLDIIMLPLLGDTSLTFGPNSVVDVDDWDCIFDDGWPDVVWFFDLPYILCHTRAYSLSIEIYRSSWSCMFIPTYKIHVKTMIYLLSYYDLLGESLLSHSVRPILFRCLDVIMLLILGDASLICWPDSTAEMDG